MSNPDKQWQKIRDAYVHEVRKALADSSHPRKKEVIDDVAQHLQQRYEQLERGRPVHRLPSMPLWPRWGLLRNMWNCSMSRGRPLP